MFKPREKREAILADLVDTGQSQRASAPFARRVVVLALSIVITLISILTLNAVAAAAEQMLDQPAR